MDSRSYLASQDVEKALSVAVSAVIQERPDDDVKRISELLKYTGGKTYSMNEFKKLDASKVEALAAAISGTLVQPGDVAYDETRKVYNAMIDKKPRIIAECKDVADVITCVNFARTNNLLLAVRSGGHSGPGHSMCDDGLVIDLSGIRYTSVDPEAMSIRVGGGCIWSDVDHAAHPFGLATPAGIINMTGVGGLALAGGSGYLTRKTGLVIDNILSMKVVLADGTFITASATENPDLFWALRGGGGNFGIVTEFTLKLHQVSTVYGGPVFFDVSRTKEIMQWYRDWMPQQPKELWCFFLITVVPSGAPFPEGMWARKVCGMMCCYAGTEAEASKLFEPVKALNPDMFGCGEMPYPAITGAFNALYPTGMQWAWKGDYFDRIEDAAIDIHIEIGANMPTDLSTMHLYPVDGAVSDVAPDATPWGHRNAKWSMVIAGIDPDPKKGDALLDWARKYQAALHPYSLGAGYLNFAMDEPADRIQASYKDNYQRLVQIKRKYDPSNFFRVNQNIPPA